MTRMNPKFASSLPLISDLVVANRILYHHKIVDGYGHVSVRHDKDPNVYLMAREIAPGLVTEGDIELYDLDSNPLEDGGRRPYNERFMHGEIYRARPDIHSIVHCHASPLLPYTVTKTPLRPLNHMCSFLGAGIAVFEIRDHGGHTDTLVKTPALGVAFAKVLGQKPMAIMRGHGVTIVGKSLKEAIYRSYYAVENATLQTTAMAMGDVSYLSEEEIKLSAETSERFVERAWNVWKRDVLREI